MADVRTPHHLQAPCSRKHKHAVPPRAAHTAAPPTPRYATHAVTAAWVADDGSARLHVCTQVCLLAPHPLIHSPHPLSLSLTPTHPPTCRRGALLHHFSFKGPVSVAKWSPCGGYIAAGVGRLVQVWVSPGTDKQLSPMQLHRTYGQCHSAVVDLDWSHDSQFIAVASKDIVAR